MSNERVTNVVAVNGTELYYEKAGSGPSVLFIAGSTGDAGNFTRAAELLSDQFTVVTYDRRGNSRSLRPPGWKTTSVREQADDAAGLIEALGLAPAAIFGHSAGGLIALDVMIRHPQLLRIGILDEPSLFSVLPDAAAALAPRRAVLTEALRTKGPRGAVAALLCHLNDDGVLTAIPADVLARMLDNADTIINIETPAFTSWRPSNEELARLRVPVVLMIARDTLPIYGELMNWLSTQLKVEPVKVSGRHGYFYYRPEFLADALRPILGPNRGALAESTTL